MTLSRSKAAAAGAIAFVLAGGYLAQGTFAAGIPANKVAASGSELEVVGANNKVVLLTETVKINNPTDLIINASAECSIITQVKTTGEEIAEAQGTVRMWVEIDGKAVPVAQEDTDAGRVVFCDRLHRQEVNFTADGDDDSDFVKTYLNTRNANSFQWLALNVGSTYQGTEDNVHTIKLWAEFYTSEAVEETFAQAAVGNRTLVLEPVKAARGEQVVELG
ncbi:MAG TPA: hypothetical protein VF519_18530 [Mycobacteriales bacterium]|jgi:hypothetical protein